SPLPSPYLHRLMPEKRIPAGMSRKPFLLKYIRLLYIKLSCSSKPPVHRSLNRCDKLRFMSDRPALLVYALKNSRSEFSGFFSSTLICPAMFSKPFTTDPMPLPIWMDSIQTPEMLFRPSGRDSPRGPGIFSTFSCV